MRKIYFFLEKNKKKLGTLMEKYVYICVARECDLKS